ncbi:hypothetical protein ASPVEDRAFT_161006 [Aspergillus versicolor CBS 583.65]|uniref:Uncharacterized protein n=1 Tax=Aspergillus versicolor CBS 583.65 TaxID=1036611 RepID=A0A1L9P940_ASPVE|nr:uncharacterized protein ASPVEDRAFT_161006 [Aspergillus versicolor CBS 583.65]OJI97993.1 hypothetical protein ASPVEDRAFT_161006 [Aspergillus versicolor CBS 583.65]
MLLPRHCRRLAIFAIVLATLVCWNSLRHTHGTAVINSQDQYPLLTKYIRGSRVQGGALRLPKEWSKGITSPIDSILAAAELVRNKTSSDPQGHIPNSNIPRIIHQTWKDKNIDAWPQTYRESAEKWMQVVEEKDIPYLFWDDVGVAQFMRYFEPDFEAEFYSLPSNVERSDVFRILVCKWIGGVYADMDTAPIRPPTEWISQIDLQPWTDHKTQKKYQSSKPVTAVVGIEADNDPERDIYWRMGYFFPVQLTQWSFAFAPHHPILQIFIDRLRATIRLYARDVNNQQPLPDSHPGVLDYVDPVNLTGPIAFTDAVRTYLEMEGDLRWDAVTGLQDGPDGGVSKLVEDVLVLPITGFSPGSRRFRDMGSKPVTHHAARLYHHAQGSWRKWNLRVEMGKFCRTAFGLCRDWSKVSHGDSWIF